MKIKFGTDGWRGIIAKDFTVDNVSRVSEATAKWLLKNFDNPVAVVGHDCRFAGALFAETVAGVFSRMGIKVLMSETIATTPMISLATKELGASVGVNITASHNPPSYNGYKLKGNFGGPLLPETIQEIEELIPDKPAYDSTTLFSSEGTGDIKFLNLEELYLKKVQESFDLDLIKKSRIQVAYDAMYGAGQDVMRKILPDITFLHAEHNPGFDGTPPEPIDKNLRELSEAISLSENIDIGIATDGDADRIGFMNSDGHFVDSHHIILLLIHYLVKYKGMSGKVVTAFSTTSRIKKMCEHYGLEHQVVKIGFKYICEIMLNDDVLLGGEESGGIAVKGHIPERDGIWIALIVIEYMARSGKNLKELIQEVYDITGPFAYERSDLHITNQQKEKVLELCKAGSYSSFGGRKIERTETTDGFKYHFKNGEWLMIRASGTEPVLRIYSEAAGKDEARQILRDAEIELLKNG